MAKCFEEANGKLVFRLLEALKAGSESGGDKRGEKSAAITVVDEKDVLPKLRVDKSPNPIQELANAIEKHLYTAEIEGELYKTGKANCIGKT